MTDNTLQGDSRSWFGDRARAGVVLAAMGISLGGCQVSDPSPSSIEVRFESRCSAPFFAGIGVSASDLQGLAIPTDFEVTQPGATSSYFGWLDRSDLESKLYVWVEPDSATEFSSEPFLIDGSAVVATDNPGDFLFVVDGALCPP
jgi:hypothetical protein